MSFWEALRAELKRPRDDRPVFWLRDDDAIEPTPALDRLLGLGVPVLLAVIPQPAIPDLAARLGDEQGVAVAVHGWSHTNHAPLSEKKQEFGAHRPRTEMRAEAGAGREKLAAMFGEKFSNVFVPPWNRIDESVVNELAGIGYRAISTFGTMDFPKLPTVNPTVDIMDWRGTRGGRAHEALVSEIITQLGAGGRPTGILAHHLVHDDMAWSFLERLIKETRELVSWARIEELL